MKITVQYAAQARNVTGTATESLELPELSSVREVLLRVVQRHAGLRGFMLTREGNPHPSLLLFVGEEQVQADEKRSMQAGEVLCILPPMAGG